MRRMDRYKEESESLPKRYEKNQELYHDVASNTKYTNITDVTNSNAFEINNSKKTYSSRESYQQMKKYQDIEPVPKVKKELEDFNFLYKNNERKVYDINSVLEEARKNRAEKDELEEKRKLKNTSYNILADLNIEELKKYREEKKKLLIEEDDFQDLVDTVATKTLAGEIDKETGLNLLSDLMATTALDKVDDAKTIDEKEEKHEEASEEPKEEKEEIHLSETKIQEIEEAKEKLDNNESKLTGADDDFYTRSMDLSDKDFEGDDDNDEKNMPLFLKILIILIVIALILAAAYFIWKKIM